MADSVVNLPYNISELNEDLPIRVQRDFEEIVRILSRLQIYENVTGKPINVLVDAGTDANGKWLTTKLTGIIDTLSNQINAGGGAVTLTDNNGILIVDNKDTPTKALRLLGGAFAIANAKDGQGNWIWRTFGTGDGFVADEITSGKLLTGLVEIIGDNYYTKILGDGFRVYDKSGALAGHFGHYEALDTQTAVFTRASTAYKQDGSLVASGIPRYEYTRIPAPVWQDLFNADDLDEYTAGGDAAATWAITGGKLTGTGGTQATLLKNGLLIQDLEIEINTDQAQDGGIIARHQDNLNYYLLTFSDSSANGNMVMFKRVAGTYINLGLVNISWTRGTSKAIKFTLRGSLLEAWFDGVKILSITDTAFTGGGVGLRNNSTPASQFLDFKVYYVQQGITIETITTNDLTANQADIETDLGGFVGQSLNNSHTITRDTTEKWRGAASVKIVSNYAGQQWLIISTEGASTPVAAGVVYTFSVRMKGTVGGKNHGLKIFWFGPGGFISSSTKWVTGSQYWNKYSHTEVSPAGATYCYTQVSMEDIAQNEGMYADGFQVEAWVWCPTSWQLPGSSRDREILYFPIAGVFNKSNWKVDLVYTPVDNQNADFNVLWYVYIDATNWYRLGTWYDGKIWLQISSGGVEYQITGGSVFEVGSAYFVTASGDGTHMRLCVNGVQIIGDVDYVEPVGNLPTNMYIGSYSFTPAWFANSVISNLRLGLAAGGTLARHIADYNTGLPLIVDEYTTYLMPCNGNLQPIKRRFGLKVINGEMTLVNPPVEGGIKVYDNLGVLRGHIGQYAAGKYGVKIIDGEIYGGLVTTGLEGDTTYIKLENHELLAYVEGYISAKISASTAGAGQIFLYNSSGVQQLRVSGNTNPGLAAYNNEDLFLNGVNGSIRLRPDGSVDINPEPTDNTCTIMGNFAVTGSGKSCIVETKDYGRRSLYAVEGPDIRLEQKGAAQMVDGVCRVDLNPIFLQTIEPDFFSAPWVIDITPHFDTRLYVAEINSAEGWFIVKECGSGTGAGRFSWSLSAVKIGCMDIYIEEFKPEGDMLTSGWEDEYLAIAKS